MKNFRALALVPLAVLAVSGCTGLNPDLPPDDGAVDMSVAPSLPDGDGDLASTEPPGNGRPSIEVGRPAPKPSVVVRIGGMNA